MYRVIVKNSNNRFEVLDLDTFKKEYPSAGTPRYTGEYFYILKPDDQLYLQILEFPNPACMYYQGQFLYIIYKGGVTIINGTRIPSADFIDELNVFASREEAQDIINKFEDEMRGEILYIDCPDGRRLWMTDPQEVINKVLRERK